MKQFILFSILSFSLLFKAFPQNKVAKVSVGHLAFKNVSVGYEYKLNNIFTLNVVAGGYIPHSTGFILNGIAQYMGVESIQGKTFGGNISPEIRVYTWRKAPKGFYFTFVAKYEAHFFNVEAEIYDANVRHDFTYESPMFYHKTNGTFGIGYQWVLNRKFTIDWTIIGIGYGIHMYSGIVETDNPRFNSEQGVLECQEELIESKPFFKNSSLIMDGNDVKFSNINFIPALHSELTIGILIKEKR